MGAGFSSFESDQNQTNRGSSSPTKPGLGDLPEACVSSVLKYLDPPEICKLALVNKAFHRASSADFVWEEKLPLNYRFLLDKVLHDRGSNYFPKKEIYARLCRPNRFDDGTKEVWLDTNGGKAFLSISSKALRITGIDDRRYWNYIPTEESRFQTVAYLQQIWWVEVLGELEFEFPPGKYSLYFRLQLGKASKRFGRRVCNLDQVHGWDIKPARFQFSTSNGHKAVSEFYLHEAGRWIHYHVGDFAVEKPKMPINIKFSMVQIDCTHTKGGLCLDSVLICPSDFRTSLLKP
ncbi:hypothetical protein UlMin_024391 [Ulmus minor]